MKSPSRWVCTDCRSEVQISLPTWYIERLDGTLEFVETDDEADALYWYCPKCDVSYQGQPEEANRATFDEAPPAYTTAIAEERGEVQS